MCQSTENEPDYSWLRQKVQTDSFSQPTFGHVVVKVLIFFTNDNNDGRTGTSVLVRWDSVTLTHRAQYQVPAITHFILYTGALPAVTCQNVSHEEGPFTQESWSPLLNQMDPFTCPLTVNLVTLWWRVRPKKSAVVTLLCLFSKVVLSNTTKNPLQWLQQSLTMYVSMCVADEVAHDSWCISMDVDLKGERSKK